MVAVRAVVEVMEDMRSRAPVTSQQIESSVDGSRMSWKGKAFQK
jgi:hypothetical protein